MVTTCHRLCCKQCKQPLAYLYAGQGLHMTIKCHRCKTINEFTLGSIVANFHFDIAVGSAAGSARAPVRVDRAPLRVNPRRRAGN